MNKDYSNHIMSHPSFDDEGREIPSGAIHFWNNTTPASVENEKLRLQLDALLSSSNTNNVLTVMMQQMLDQQKNTTVRLIESSLNEIKTLSSDLQPMNKALKYKKAKAKEVDTEEQIRESIRARKILKVGLRGRASSLISCFNFLR